MTIAEFILARIAEDEADWRVVDARPEVQLLHGRPIAPRMLAECEAKRRIVSLHPEMLGWCQGCAHETHPCRTLLALSAVYADHPDYDEEWRP